MVMGPTCGSIFWRSFGAMVIQGRARPAGDKTRDLAGGNVVLPVLIRGQRRQRRSALRGKKRRDARNAWIGCWPAPTFSPGKFPDGAAGKKEGLGGRRKHCGENIRI